MFPEDGPGRKGKFFKSNSKLVKNLKLKDYSFEEIKQATLIGFDNVSRSIIHSKYHLDSELGEAIQPPHSMDMSLIDPNHQPPIIMPLDFTKDWHAERMNRKRRVLGFEDEDDFDFSSVITAQVDAQAQKKDAAQNPLEKAAAVPTAPVVITKVEVPKSEPPKEEVHSLVLPEIKKNVEPQSQTTSAPTAKLDDFVQLDQSSEKIDLKKSVVSNAAEPAPSSSVISFEAMQKEAEARGFIEGFKLGEEKAEIQVKQQAHQMLAGVKGALQSLKDVKKDVLKQAEQNFYELAQALSEAVIGREFSLDPSNFVKLLQKAVHESIKEDVFTIKVHPKIFEAVSKLEVPEIIPHLVQDPTIEYGNFKLESQLTSVDGNIKSIIEKFLQQIDAKFLRDVDDTKQEIKKAS